MTWAEVRAAYPSQWVVVEALEAHTTPDHLRHIERLAVVESCPDGRAAQLRYRALHRTYPERELLFVHTSRAELDIPEKLWLGIRCGDAAHA